MFWPNGSLAAGAPASWPDYSSELQASQETSVVHLGGPQPGNHTASKTSQQRGNSLPWASFLYTGASNEEAISKWQLAIRHPFKREKL
jgi:hypothetical protein